MNIFVLDTNPITAAKYHCDQDVSIMVVQVAELLSFAHHLHPGKGYKPDRLIKLRMDLEKNPWAIWIRKSISNYHWVCELGKGLIKEYEFRFGKKHRYKALLRWLRFHDPKLSEIPITKLPLCMPTKYHHIIKIDGEHVLRNAVKSYRRFYRGEQRFFITGPSTYTRRKPPIWWIEFTQPIPTV